MAGGRLGPQGPSLGAVMGLNVSKPPSEIGGPRPQPPLQRLNRPMLGHPLPTSEADCTLSHLQQLKEQHREHKRATRDARRGHRQDMKELCKACEVELEETAARKAWSRAIASDHQVQRDAKQQRELDAHRETHSDKSYFPFNSKQGGAQMPDAPTYAQMLRSQAEEDRRREALRLLQEGKKTGAAVPLLAASLPAELPPKGDSSASHDARTANLEERTRRAVELRLRLVQQEQQKQRYAAKMMRELEREEALSAARGLQNKQQLKQVLALQAADKTSRDMREHVKLYGEHGGLLGPEKDTRKTQVAMRKQELELAIAEAQRERRRLKAARKAEQQEARRQHREGELLDARDASAQQQQQAELKLEWAKQEAELRLSRRHEAERSYADRVRGEALGRATRGEGPLGY
tara:strand:+ start:33 stop:1253 length:1221 start_codon:yes stop_codon:yes gene_type:complete